MKGVPGIPSLRSNPERVPNHTASWSLPNLCGAELALSDTGEGALLAPVLCTRDMRTVQGRH